MAEKEHIVRRYLSETEVAEFLGVAERTLRDWRQKGRIDMKGTKPPRSYVRGRHIYYNENELVKWIEAGATDVCSVSAACAWKRRTR